MQAVLLERHGDSPAVTTGEAPRPRPGPGEFLLHVRAAAVTATELGWDESWTARDGAIRPRPIPGHELCGDVVELGQGTTGVHRGERLFGLTNFSRDGAQAEYAIATPAEMAPAPPSIDDVHAAALPIAALTAWQALFDHARLKRGQTVLIHGAAGGVGSIAVQLARWAGLHVIGTASTGNVDLVRSLGADEVIDYTRTRFEEVVRGADAVLDTVGSDTLERSFGVLARGGTLVSIVQPPPAGRAEQYGVNAVFFVVHPDRSQLRQIGELVDRKILVPIVDAVLPLARAPEAYARLAKGHARGKTVIEMTTVH